MLAGISSVSTSPATSVTSTAAVLNGAANPNGETTTAWFRLHTTDPGSCSDGAGTRVPENGGSALGAGTSSVPFNAPVSSLLPGLSYYFCAVASNASGVSVGSVRSFTTPALAPTVSTEAATSIANNAATFNGQGIPNGSSTTGYFRYSTTSPGTCNNTFGARVPAGGGTVLGAGHTVATFNETVTGLLAGTTYYYCAIATNGIGTTYGNLLSFTTLVAPPEISAASASVTGGTTATLSATATPNGAAATGWFRYSTSPPGSCNDTFGTRAPASGGTPLGSGSVPYVYTQPLTGLSVGTTYYYCAIASNAAGFTYGEVQTFTTWAAPQVVTSAESGVAGTSATLNATASAGGAAATGWFRYGTTNPGTCDDSFGTRYPSSGGSSIPAGASSVPYAYTITGLTPATTYYFCAGVTSAVGTVFGAVRSFTTPALAPSVSTQAATSVLGATATLNGTAAPRGAAAIGYFRLGTTNPTTCSDGFGTRIPGADGTDLGAGHASQAFSQDVTDLSPGTTYYVCAAATNSVGTTFGAVVSFTTAAAPTMTTTGVTALTATTATLNGSGVANRAAGTGWFRYGTTDPGTCNDTFGTRAPISGASSIGSGTTAVTYAAAISSLVPGTTYYFCAIGSNVVGKSFGSVVSFTTLAAPTVTSVTQSNLTATSATLNGTANPNRAATIGWLRYSTLNPGTCSDSFGTRVPTTVGTGTDLGTGTSPMPFYQNVTGLLPATTYYFCAVASNSVGTSFGSLLSFTTPAVAPYVSTGTATAVLGTSATLNGTGTPRGTATVAFVRYGTTNPSTCTDSFGTRVPASNGTDIGAGHAAEAFSQEVTGLVPGTTYYFCAGATNAAGTTYGSVGSFTTAALPTVTTAAASSIGGTTAILNGSAVPNRAATSGWYRYSTTSPGAACNDTFGTRLPTSGGTSLGSGTSAAAFPLTVTGLSPGTTYYFCAIASNVVGTALGAVMSFTTAAAPTVTTVAASDVTATSATMNATANPNGATSTGWFRYSTTEPASCNDTFGTRVPATTGGTDLGAGATPVPYLQSLTSLTPATTYYYCAIASNSVGPSFGAVMSFTTPARAPLVTTSAATSVSGTTATLNGAATPRGAATTGYFRYGTTNPGTCSDSFGTRAPADGGTELGAGHTSMPFSLSLTGLTPGTTYYYCAAATNSAGTSFGAVSSFVGLAPTVTTSAATAVTGTTATLNASANPRGDAAVGYFRYAVTSPGTCNDTFGTRAPASGGSELGAGTTSVTFSQNITGLVPGVTYYACALASNAVGTSYGALVTFTMADVPTMTTGAATGVTGTAATLSGTGVPNRAAATGWFRYATTSPGACNDTFGTRAPADGGAGLGSGTTSAAYSQALAGLTPGTTYYFCAIGSNVVGTGLGAIQTFVTPAAPTITTLAPSSLTGTAATLSGSGTANGATTSAWFRISETDPGACNETFGTRVPSSGTLPVGSGYVPTSFSSSTSVTPGRTYYYCALGSSSVGTTLGNLVSFTAPAMLPATTTSAPTLVTGSTATLNGSANPRGAAAVGFFRYGTTNPTTCTDAFGTRVPATGGTDVGSGNVSAPFAESLTGLIPGTTYYVCAGATNSVGTGYGTVTSFTTAAAPTITTIAATTSVTGNSATLNGSGVANRAAATGWFRYGTTNPGTCNDIFGTRAPATGGTSLGSGTTATAYAQTLSSLTPGTTYYFCAIASNSVGTSFGEVMSFTLPAAPTVTTSPADPVTATSATLKATGVANNATATGWFRYSTINPGTCSDSFGTRLPSTGGTSLGAATAVVPYTYSLTSLAPNTTYYFCAMASNSVGTSFGALLSFTTPATAPIVSTTGATSVAGSTATLGGSANPRGLATSGYFRIGTTDPTTCTETFGTRLPANGGTDLGAGTTSEAYTLPITGLTPGTTYYYCAAASNSLGTSFGAVSSFVTASAPTVTTVAPSSVTGTTATLNGTGNPNRVSSTAWFRYSTTDPGSCDDTFGTRAPLSGNFALGSGSTATTFTHQLTSLTPGATYYYCAIATNSVGTSFGSVLTFTTPAGPAVTTSAATSVTATSATLNASANPNGATSTGWFRYSTTSPASCSDTFGTRLPATSGGTALGAGTSPAPYTYALTGLLPGTTYYYCALASNSVGTSWGAVLSFTTPSTAPIVTTSSATPVTAHAATLNGSANPRGAATTAYFRYSTTNPGTCNDTFGIRVPEVDGTTLGSGNAVLPFSASITGLSLMTTYYVCAIASNAMGTSFGGVVSFTTPATAPTVTTVAPSDLTGTSVVMNASAIPNGSSATGWFRYGTVNPGSCNDSFGVRAPAGGGTALGAGTVAMSYSVNPTILTPGVTYYYCAIASNGVGTSYGEVLSFTTPSAPSLTTSAASDVTGTSAVLNASATPNGASTNGWFRYSLTNPGSCNDTFGTRVPLGPGAGTSLGAGTSAVVYSQTITGLAPGTTYYFCAIASNTIGTSYGAVLTVTTTNAPVVATSPVTAVTGSSATLNGVANPNGSSATGYFRYAATDPGTCNDTFGTRVPAADGVALGAGTADVPYAQPLSGLTAGTTYYVCAIASNASGASYGSVVSFTVAAAPTVTTGAPTALTAASVTLNGSADPNGVATTGHFRYATTDPGTCNDTFGTRAPAADGTVLGAGDAAVGFSQTVAGLQASTTYYYCAIASNSLGSGFGAVQSFTTASAPVATTTAASDITSTGATLNGSVDPRHAEATAHFRYSSTNPGTCDDAFGSRVPTLGGTVIDATSGVTAVAEIIEDLLLPGTTYYYCVIATNAVGTSYGAVLSFSTAASPTVTTGTASDVTETSATLAGAANPRGGAATGYFRYAATDPGTCNDSFGSRAPASDGAALGPGTSSVAFSQTLTGLTAGTTYYYCAIASNAMGTGFGAISTFTTAARPAVSTGAATAVTTTTATLNGTANPNRLSTTGSFRYGTTDPGTCSAAFGTPAPLTGGTALGSGEATVAYAETITGLLPGTTYYFCAAASNSVGTSFGAVSSFTTPARPAVTTEAASAVTATAAILNGTGNPSGLTATGHFRYGTTNPGTCTETFGTRVPTSGGTSLGAGTAAVAYQETISGLQPGTTYYFCALAANSAGTGFGAVLSFTTSAAAPTVTTSSASAVGNGSATLNGSADPNGASTTGWFRMDTTNPGTCTDSFGTRVPAQDGSVLGAGNAPVGWSETVTGLTAGTTYYFCAIASSAAGTAFGTVVAFTADLPAPTVTTEPAADIAGTRATLHGTANPNAANATGWFRYDAVAPSSCNDTFGTRVPTDAIALGAGTAAVPYSAPLTGLEPNRTYYACAIATNAGGAAFGSVVSFTTPAIPPAVVTLPAVTTDGVTTLSGTANPNGAQATAWFQYGTDDPGTCTAGFGVRIPSVGAPIGDGRTEVPVSQSLSALTPGRYYACAAADNAAGTSYGAVVSFEIAEVGADAGVDAGGDAGSDGGGARDAGGDTTGDAGLADAAVDGAGVRDGAADGPVVPADAGGPDGGAPASGGSGGCGCDVTPAGPLSWAVIGLLSALVLRRRRRDGR